MRSGLIRTLAVLLGMLLGGLFPGAHRFSALIPWLIMGMLYAVSLESRFVFSSVTRSHAYLFIANLAISLAAFAIGELLGGPELAQGGFFAGIAPTATAAPVVMSLLGGRVDYVVAAFFISNVGMALLMPFVLPLVLGHPTPEALVAVGQSMLLVVGLPLLLAALTRRWFPGAASLPRRLRDLVFAAWVLVLFLVMARVSHFLLSQAEVPVPLLFQIATSSLLVCLLSYGTGRILGGATYPDEASQSLGQKNTTFTLFLALTYASPLVALGPSFYVIWHNLYNAFLLHRRSRALSARSLPHQS